MLAAPCMVQGAWGSATPESEPAVESTAAQQPATSLHRARTHLSYGPTAWSWAGWPFLNVTTTHKSGNEARGRVTDGSSLALEGCIPTGTVRQQPVLPRTTLLSKTYWRALPREPAIPIPGGHTGHTWLPRRIQDTFTAYCVAQSKGQTYNHLNNPECSLLWSSLSVYGRHGLGW